MRKRSALAALIVTLSACTENKSPPPPEPSAAPPASASSASTSTTASASGSVEQVPPSPPGREIAGAQLVLVTWKGAELAPPGVARSKADAQKRAEEAASKIKKDSMAFEEAVKKYSDDPVTKRTAGMLGNFERSAMPPAFSTATFDLKVGDVSDVVETARGFYIIKRTR